MINKNCIQCSKVFRVYKYRLYSARFCGQKCSGKWRSLNMCGKNSVAWRGGKSVKKICLWCKKEYTTYPYYPTQKFCKVSCGSLYNNKIQRDRQWSKEYKDCTRCKTTNIKHEGLGLCKKCYGIKKNQLARYGITIEDFDNMCQKQAGKCLICGETPKKDRMGRALAIDHNHKNGQIRGLLCLSCNTALGLFKDNIKILQAAIIYIKRSMARD